MKRFLLSFIALVLVAGVAGAQDNEALRVHAGSVEEVIIADDMNVVLVQDATDTLTRMDGKAAQQLNLSFSSGKLFISPHRYDRKAVVYLVIKNLTKLTIGASSRVVSGTPLHLGKLDLYLYDGSYARLQTDGKVKAHSLGQYELTLLRVPAASVKAF